MQNLTLDLESLNVETFDTTSSELALPVDNSCDGACGSEQCQVSVKCTNTCCC